MSKAVLHTEGLTRHFGGLTAVEDVSIGVEPGQVHAIIGPNGAGKSTMVNLLSGHLPPSAGRVVYDGPSAELAEQPELLQEHIGL